MAEAGTKLSLDQKIQVVRDAFAAFNRGDMKGLTNTWTDDFVWHARGSVFGGDFKGKDVALGAIARYPQELEDIKLDLAPRSRAVAGDSFLPEGMTLDEHEQSLIREALKRANGNKSQAARLLGLTRNALRYRLTQMGLES